MSGRMLRLTFHGLGEAPPGAPDAEALRWVDPERAAAILDLVADRPDVGISFDDGFASDAEVALPLLRERGLRATFFVVAGRLGRPGFLDGAALRELAGAGMEVGSHGMRHRAWRGLGDADLHEELVRARALLATELGAPVRHAACPAGRYDRRVLRALRRAGYERVFTSDGGLARTRAWLQPRNTVLRTHAPERVAHSGGARRGRLAGTVLRGVKRIR